MKNETLDEIQEINYIIELLKCAVTEETPSIPAGNLDWDRIFLFAKQHRICSTLYFGIQKLPKNIWQQVGHYDQFLLSYKKNLVLDSNRTYELNLLRQDFEKHHIDYIFLKGSVTKHLYPDTSMRVMNDVDIFYRNADIRTVTDIFCKHGYHIIKKEPKEITFFKSSCKIKIEMQTQLVDAGYEVWSRYMENIWDKCIPLKGNHQYHMTDEDFYIYHILHMAKHFINGGIGLTHILDIWMMRNTYTDLDEDYIQKTFRLLSLDVFESRLKQLVDVWFNHVTPEPEDARILELMTEYIFSGGAFGTTLQKETNSAASQDKNHIPMLRKIFPDKNTMVNYYGSAILKHPLLLPFYYIRLNCKRLFFDWKQSKKVLKSMNRITEDRIQKTKELMDRCGF